MIEPFVDVAWVREHRDEIVVADCRWYLDGRSGRDAYVAAHLAGAVFVELDTALTRHTDDPAAGGRHPLPDPEDFAAAMGALGIGEEDVVVAYDDAGGVIAARFVWMLRAIGHEAALLDGGLGAWDGELAAGPGAWSIEVGETSREPAFFATRPWPADRIVSADEVAAASAALAHDPAAPAIIDARPADRFAGEPDDLDPRAGHIPGARSVPCRENLYSDGHLHATSDLREAFAVDDATDVISSCGSGVTACHNLLAMEQAGLGRGRLFPGSWSQWSRDPDRPVQTGGE
jgi:thiosulfate/3-mercaptopyruvate sulfurtransferase